MKESKFIELLNLYIDQQIEPAEALVLEDEIMRNPARRRVYQQYCRMHRASTLLFDQAAPHSAGESAISGSLATAVEEANEKVLEFPEPSHHFSRWATGAGILATAACVALIAIVSGPPANTDVAENLSASVANAERAVVVPVIDEAIPAVAAPRQEYRGMFVSTLKASVANELESAAADREMFQWMSKVQLAPVAHVTSEQPLFQSQPSLRNSPNTFLRPVATETAAWQFQK